MTRGDHTDGIKSVGRTFRIIEALKRLDGATLTELCEEMDMSRSTVHRYLASIEECGYLSREGDEYHLGLRFHHLGEYVYTRERAYRIARPKIEKLAAETGERAQFWAEEHGDVYYIHMETGEEEVNTGSRLRGPLPIHATAAGKSILSRLPAGRVDDILATHEFEALTEHTITDEEVYREELERVRERGHGFNDQEYVEGLRTVGVPVLHPDGAVLGAVTVSGPVYRLSDERFREELPEILKSVANEIRLNLSY